MPRLMTRIHGISVTRSHKSFPVDDGYSTNWAWWIWLPGMTPVAYSLEEAADVIVEALSRTSVVHYVADIDAKTIRTECGNVDHFDSLCNVINAVTCKECRQEYADRMVAEFQAQCDC